MECKLNSLLCFRAVSYDAAPFCKSLTQEIYNLSKMANASTGIFEMIKEHLRNLRVGFEVKYCGMIGRAPKSSTIWIQVFRRRDRSVSLLDRGKIQLWSHLQARIFLRACPKIGETVQMKRDRHSSCGETITSAHSRNLGI